MRVAVISDTHGNLPALEAALAAVDATGPWDLIAMGGDIAFGGPFPGECVALLRERGIPAVRGNTDEAIVEAARGPQSEWRAQEGYWEHSPQAKVIDEWALARMSQDDVDFLASLPLRLDIGEPHARLTLVHATPKSPYPVYRPGASEEDVARLLLAAGSQTLAYGHIHLQHMWHRGTHQLVAVGSVGMPFDGVPEADYAVFELDGDSWRVQFHQVPYDVERTAAAAQERGLPGAESYGERLRSGLAG